MTPNRVNAFFFRLPLSLTLRTQKCLAGPFPNLWHSCLAVCINLHFHATNAALVYIYFLPSCIFSACACVPTQQNLQDNHADELVTAPAVNDVCSFNWASYSGFKLISVRINGILAKFLNLPISQRVSFVHLQSHSVYQSIPQKNELRYLLMSSDDTLQMPSKDKLYSMKPLGISYSSILSSNAVRSNEPLPIYRPPRLLPWSGSRTFHRASGSPSIGLKRPWVDLTCCLAR